MRIAAMVSIFLGIAAMEAVGDPSTADDTKAWGWRGDGTGRFPNAEPTIKWGHISAALKGLTTQADKPKGGAGQGSNSGAQGNIAEWLVLGPFNFDPDGKVNDILNKELVPGEAALKAGAGEKVGALQWQKIPSTGALLNLNNHFKDMKGKAFYAHAYLHSKEQAGVFARLVGPACRFWLNGTEIVTILKDDEGRPRDKEIELRQGWNSLLVKVCCFPAPPETGYLQVVLCGRAGDRHESDGILWEASLPGAPRFSCAQPLIVGDRVFVNADPSFLICFDKLTGKRIWTSYCGHYEFVTEAERRAIPQIFQELDPKVARIKAQASVWTGAFAEIQELHTLVGDVGKLMRQVDNRRYAGVADRQEAGIAGLTSCSDGKFIYTWFANGVAVCHDLNGKRKWMTLENEGRRGGTDNDNHGYQISPLLTDSEFVVRMRGVIAFDKATGKFLWRTGIEKGWPPPDPGSPIPAEGTNCVVYDEMAIYKPGVGLFGFSGGTIAGRRAYAGGCLRDSVDVWEIPETLSKNTPLKPRGGLNGGTSAPLLNPNAWAGKNVQANVLVHEGLIYSVTMAGPFRVHDEATMQLVYSVRVDLNTVKFTYPYPHGSGVCASPALGGKYIYIFGNGGTTLVIKPGRTFEVVAQNRIERLLPGRYQGAYVVPTKDVYHPECTVSSPIFDGKRIYYQGEGYLYCIGKAK